MAHMRRSSLVLVSLPLVLGLALMALAGPAQAQNFFDPSVEMNMPVALQPIEPCTDEEVTNDADPMPVFAETEGQAGLQHNERSPKLRVLISRTRQKVVNSCKHSQLIMENNNRVDIDLRGNNKSPATDRSTRVVFQGASKEEDETPTPTARISGDIDPAGSGSSSGGGVDANGQQQDKEQQSASGSGEQPSSTSDSNGGASTSASLANPLDSSTAALPGDAVVVEKSKPGSDDANSVEGNAAKQCKEESWQKATVMAPWTSYTNIMFRRDCDGMVWLRGSAQMTATEAAKVSASNRPPILQLPEGYRPMQWSAFRSVTGHGQKRIPFYDGTINQGFVGTIYLSSDGSLVPQEFDYGFVSVDQVRFFAADTEDNWKTVTPLGSWTSYSESRIGFRRDSRGTVHLRGTVKFPIGEASKVGANYRPPVLTLPDGFRPSQWLGTTTVTGHGPVSMPYFDVVINQAMAGTIYISSDGDVVPQSFNTGFLSLDAIEFAAADIEKDWVNADLMKPWTPYASYKIQYRKDVAGNVYLRGFVMTDLGVAQSVGSANRPPVMVLPAGFRPQQLTMVTGVTGHGPTKVPHYDAMINQGVGATIYITTDGAVVPQNFDHQFLALDEIIFNIN